MLLGFNLSSPVLIDVVPEYELLGLERVSTPVPEPAFVRFLLAPLIIADIVTPPVPSTFTMLSVPLLKTNPIVPLCAA